MNIDFSPDPQLYPFEARWSRSTSRERNGTARNPAGFRSGVTLASVTPYA